MRSNPFKLIFLLLAMLIQLAYTGNQAFAEEACVKVDPNSDQFSQFDLYAGQHTMLGTVGVGVVGDQLEITYDITTDG